MKKINVALMSLIVLMASSLVSCNKITSMDNVRGYKVVEDNRYVVVDMNDNQEPLAQAIRLRVPDTIGRQGIAGVVAGELIAENLGGAGCNEEFHFTYNNGEKEFSYTVSGDFALEYGDGKVYPLHKFTLTGEFSVVSERTTPTYLQISKVDWTLRNPENGAIAAKATSYHKIYEDPRDSVVIVYHDTVWQNIVDTLIVWQHDTIFQVIYDTVVVHGDTTTYTTYIMRKHYLWNNIYNNFVYGTDSVTLFKLDETAAVISTNRGTYQHRTPVNHNVPTMPSAVAGNCYNFTNGVANCEGTNVTCSLGATQVVGPVVIGGIDITAYLQGCQPYAQRICFSNLSGNSGTYTIYIVGHDGENAGTITGTYTINEPPQPPTPGEFNPVYAAVVDRYWTAVVSDLSQRETDLVVIESYGSGYKVLWGEWSATLTRSQCDSITISASDYSWLTGKIAAGYAAVMVPSHSNSSQYFGAVKSEQVGGDDGYWKLTYDIVAGNAYVMSNSAWTLAGYSGRNALRGVMTSTGSITADGITKQLQ